MVEIVWAVATVLLGITGWLIVTGRHDRYYNNTIEVASIRNGFALRMAYRPGRRKGKARIALGDYKFLAEGGSSWRFRPSRYG